ncbi:MAG: hypothetical protein JWM12_4158, partial [Ilumatobacteraceae bacterium]|nr:hypothetical protein [Ilumatobacteraceae bacterium]
MSGVAGDGPVGCKLLDGVTVVEVAHELTEYAGTILAGLGAEVWLVEPPAGCRTRQRRPFAEQASASRQSIPFLARNAGKRSVVIDPADPSAAAAFAALLARADVVIEHQESGIGAWTAAADVPVVRITDPDGIGASSVVVFAASGSLSSSGWPHQPPCNAPSWLALDAVGTFAAAMAVLLVREHRVSGRRRRCDVPVQEAGIAGLTNWTRNMHSYGTASAGQGAETKRLGSGPFPVFPCADGYVRIIAATPRQWEAMLELLDRPELLLQPEWASFQFRNENFDVIFLVAAEILATRRADDVFHRGQSLGLPVAPVLGLPSVIGDPHVRAREMFTTVQDPEVGPVQMLRAAVRTGEA